MIFDIGRQYKVISGLLSTIFKIKKNYNIFKSHPINKEKTGLQLEIIKTKLLTKSNTRTHIHLGIHKKIIQTT